VWGKDHISSSPTHGEGTGERDTLGQRCCPIPCPPHAHHWGAGELSSMFRLSLKQHKATYLRRCQANPHKILELFTYF